MNGIICPAWEPGKMNGNIENIYVDVAGELLKEKNIYYLISKLIIIILIMS